MAIRYHCECGKAFQLPDAAAGKRARCLQCGKVFTVPGGRPRRAAAPRPAGPPDDDVPVARAISEPEAALKATVAAPGGVGFLVKFASAQAAAETLARLSFARSEPNGIVLPPHLYCQSFTAADGVLVVLGGQMSDPEFTEIFNRMEKFGSVETVRRYQPPAEADDDVPIARAVPEPRTPGEAAALAARQAKAEAKVRPHQLARQTAFPLGNVKTAMLISAAVLGVALMDIIVFVAQRSMAGARQEGWWHAIWVPGLMVGFVVAMLAARGSPVCIGIMIGGAAGALALRAPVTLFAAAAQIFPRWVAAVGAVELVLGGTYLMLLLSTPVRKRLAGHGGSVLAGAIFGFFPFTGELTAASVYPSPLMLFTHQLYTPKASPLLAKWFPSLEAAGQERRQKEAHDCFTAMTYGFNDYIKANHNDLPPNLAALKASERFDPGKMDSLDGNVVYLFGAVNGVTYMLPQFESEDKDLVRGLVMAYLRRDRPFDKGVLVLRPPISGVELVVWVPKDIFADELKDTQRWLADHPPKYGAITDPNKPPTVE